MNKGHSLATWSSAEQAVKRRTAIREGMGSHLSFEVVTSYFVNSLSSLLLYFTPILSPQTRLYTSSSLIIVD